MAIVFLCQSVLDKFEIQSVLNYIYFPLFINPLKKIERRLHFVNLSNGLNQLDNDYSENQNKPLQNQLNRTVLSPYGFYKVLDMYLIRVLWFSQLKRSTVFLIQKL